jgi:ATP-dependent Clp protease adapter protein ClpS
MSSKLYLINDDKNTFKYVYAVLMRDLQMLPIQAESCCQIAHNVGKCHIKTGDILELLDFQQKLEKRNIKSEIENG